MGGAERLQKLLARAGYGSRRACEELIRMGSVAIDGTIVTELGTKADPAEQAITVDGRRLRAEAPVYYLVNKPKGVLCTNKDPAGRPTVLDLLPGERRRVFAVGRLDGDSRGALIVTNDGSFTNLLTHPRYGVEKTYTVRVRGTVSDGAIERLRAGVWLSEGRTLPARVWVVKRKDDETELGISISEGKNRQVRRMLAKVGHKVQGLTRTRIGALTLRGLGDGHSRELTKDEVQALRRQARKNAESAPAKLPKGRPRGRGKPDPAHPIGGPPVPVWMPGDDDAPADGQDAARPRPQHPGVDGADDFEDDDGDDEDVVEDDGDEEFDDEGDEA
jgi:23S rRNA pseudouridine2605 synthase